MCIKVFPLQSHDILRLLRACDEINSDNSTSPVRERIIISILISSTSKYRELSSKMNIILNSLFIDEEKRSYRLYNNGILLSFNT